MMTFYYFHPACSMASHICLEESQLAYVPRRIDLGVASDVEELRICNPRCTVPALSDNGIGLSENVAIMSYVNSLAPAAGLIPADPMQAAQCMSLLSWSSSAVHINFRRSMRPERFCVDPTTHDAIRMGGREAFWENLCWLDSRLRDRPYLLGGAFSAADAYALKFFEWAHIAKHPVNQLPGLVEFKDRMIARPAVRRVLERESSPLIGGGD